MDTTTSPIGVAATPLGRPEFYRCPAPKARDAFFGLSRGWYYKHFLAGDIRMVPLRTRGQTRGVALIDYKKR